MRSFQFKLNNRVVTVGNLNPVSFLYRSARAVCIALLILLPLAFLSSTLVYSEDLAFGFYAAAVLLGVGLFISLLLYKGKSILIDPLSFVNVLIFALLVITPTVISTPSSAANTFGVIGIRSISGLATILFVIAFYLINVYNLRNRLWTMLPKVASVVNVVVLFSLLITEIYTKQTFANTLTMLAVVSLINFALTLSVNSKRFQLINAVVLALINIFVFRFVTTEFKVVASLIFAAIFYFLILRSVKGIGAKNLKAAFLTNIKLQSYALGVAISMVTLILTVLSTGVGSLGSINKILNYFTNFGSLDATSIGQILLGKGLLSASSSSNSTLYIIITSFGLVALAGFLYLFIYVLLKEIKAKKLINTLVLVLVAIGSIFVNLGVYVNIVFLLILIDSARATEFQLSVNLSTSKVGFRYGRKAFVLAVLLVTVVVIFNLLKLLKIIV